MDTNIINESWLSASKVFKWYSIFWLIVTILMFMFWSAGDEYAGLGIPIFVNLLCSIGFYVVSRLLRQGQITGKYLGFGIIVLFIVLSIVSGNLEDLLTPGIFIILYPIWKLIKLN